MSASRKATSCDSPNVREASIGERLSAVTACCSRASMCWRMPAISSARLGNRLEVLPAGRPAAASTARCVSRRAPPSASTAIAASAICCCRVDTKEL